MGRKESKQTNKQTDQRAHLQIMHLALYFCQWFYICENVQNYKILNFDTQEYL